MRVSSTKTARFAAIVKECGKPEVVSLWGAPSPEFLKAARQDRVMTVKQETVGAKADFGVVGFLQERNVSYLLFPKSLARFKDTRVIGIKYDLVESGAGLAGYSKPEKAAPAAKSKGGTAKGPQPGKETVAAAGSPVKEAEETKTPTVEKHPKRELPSKAMKQTKPEKPPEPEPRFEVTVRFTAEADMTTVVQARNQAAARRLAEEMVRPPDMARVGVTKRVLKVKKQG